MSDTLPTPKRTALWLILLVVVGLLAISGCQQPQNPGVDGLQRDLVFVGEVSVRRLQVPTEEQKFFINESYSLDSLNTDATYDDSWLVSPCMQMLYMKFSLDEANGDISVEGTTSLFNPIDPTLVYGEDDIKFKAVPCKSESLSFSYSEPGLCSAEVSLVFFNAQR